MFKFSLKYILAAVLLHVGAAMHAQEEVAASPAELMKGKFSGVRVSAVDGAPDGLYNVNIRGLNTLRGDSQPLWIVDGAVIGTAVNDYLDAWYLSGGKTVNGDRLPDYSGRSYTAPIGNFGWLNLYDVESIEVIKDVSATALYGMQAADGVVIIRTRKPDSGKSVRLNSSVGAGFSSRKGAAFRTGVITTHDLGVAGVLGTDSYYNVSGFIRYNNAEVRNANSTSGGLSVNLETAANHVFQFGINTRLYYGGSHSSAGTNFIGSPSVMMLSRYPDSFAGDDLSGWLGHYDDEAVDCRSVNSAWLNVNILKSLRLKVSGGADYQNLTRYLWHGAGTSFGKEFNGAASILNASLLNANARGELVYDRNFVMRHHLLVTLAADLNGSWNKTNAMCGTNFTNPALRARGLSSSGSIQAVNKFSVTHVRMGALAMIGYDYNGYAGLTGTVRCDYTRKYDREPIWLPSGEAFVDLGRIFFRDNDVISEFRFSGGYGWAGKEKVMPYEYMPSYIFRIPEVELGMEPYFTGVNRLLSKEYNVGFSMGFLRDRFNLSMKYYDKNTADMFRICNFGKLSDGYWVETKNWVVDQEQTSTIRNRGFEVDADFIFIQSDDVDWSVRASAAYNLNQIVSLDPLDHRPADVVRGLYAQELMEGLSVGQIFGKRTLPNVYGGFGTTLSLFGVTLQADFSGAAGFSLINANRLVEKGLDYLSPEDVERGDYLRMDRLGLAYEIPVTTRWMKSFQVSLSAHNLFVLTGYSGWNPDVNSFGRTAFSHGVDYGSYPFRRQIVLGLNFRF